jgi:hypothetical protein
VVGGGIGKRAVRAEIFAGKSNTISEESDHVGEDSNLRAIQNVLNSCVIAN